MRVPAERRGSHLPRDGPTIAGAGRVATGTRCGTARLPRPRRAPKIPRSRSPWGSAPGSSPTRPPPRRGECAPLRTKVAIHALDLAEPTPLPVLGKPRPAPHHLGVHQCVARPPRPPTCVRLRHPAGRDAGLTVGDGELEAHHTAIQRVLVRNTSEHDPLAVHERASGHIATAISVVRLPHRSLSNHAVRRLVGCSFPSVPGAVGVAPGWVKGGQNCAPRRSDSEESMSFIYNPNGVQCLLDPEWSGGTFAHVIEFMHPYSAIHLQTGYSAAAFLLRLLQLL